MQTIATSCTKMIYLQGHILYAFANAKILFYWYRLSSELFTFSHAHAFVKTAKLF